MTQPAAPFEVTPDRPRELSTGQRAARVLAGATPAPGVDDAAPVVVPRTVSLRAVFDAAGGACIIGGFAVGDLAAWTAGGKVPGLATLGGALIAVGMFLAYR